MSLIDMSQLVFSDRTDDDPAVVYRLVYDARRDPAAGFLGGWTLIASGEGARAWSTSLAPRGAAPSAGARVARAVAVRVLRDRGVTVEGWSVESEDDRGSPTRFRARLRPA